MARHGMLLASIIPVLAAFQASAQTTAGIGTTIVFPVTAQTASFASEVTIFNPGPNALTAHVTFFEANNSATPGTKVCTDAAVPANRSFQFSIGTQCPLAAGSHFGLLIVADSANPQSNAFYGYTRVQNPAGIGFSVEGFPVQNFNNQVSHATGLKRQAASPTYQTNCFVGSLEQPVSYELKLFSDTTGTQIGNTLTGSLNAFEQFRYLDVFGPNGVNAPGGDQFNVRAQFTQTSGGTANLIGFCTVQDNTSFGADFRIAKSYGSPSNSFFAQGGNTFGTNAKLGTLDNQPLEIYVNNQRVVRYEPNATSPNFVAGHSNNSVSGAAGQTVAGGGQAGNGCYEPSTNTFTRSCANQAGAAYGTVGGGLSNHANGLYTTVAGGNVNTASQQAATVAGGSGNTASGGFDTVAGGGDNTASGGFATVVGGYNNTASGPYATVAGGNGNTASGLSSFAAGSSAIADQGQCFVFANWSSYPSSKPHCLGSSNVARFMVDHGLSVDYFSARNDGGGNRWVYFGDLSSGNTILAWSGAHLTDGGAWTNASGRNLKENFRPIDTGDVLRRVAMLPVTHWNYRTEPGVRRMGPVAEDFYATFALGSDDQSISTVDASGVALAAIQGLHQLVQEKDARIAALERSVAELRRIVEALATRR